MYTAGTIRIDEGFSTHGVSEKNAAVSPMARYAYKNELGEQVREALASRAFVLSDAFAVVQLVRSH